MPFPQRILFAADGSHESDLARSHVVDLVHGAGSQLHVVHVGLVSPWTNPRTMSTDQLERLRSEARQVLDRELEALAEAGVVPVEAHLAMGRATDEVLRVRDRVEADLVVVGSRGLNAFSRVLLGSDATSIARHAPCSVLIVRRDA